MKFADFSKELIEALGDNDILIYVGANDPVQVFAKFRGATALEMGYKMGQTVAGLTAQIGLLRQEMVGRGEEQGKDFNRGYNHGLKHSDLKQAGIKVIERGERK